MTREIIEGSKAFTLVNVREDADYWLDITVSRLNVKDVPGDVLQYKMVLSDKGGNEVGSWMESIRQVQMMTEVGGKLKAGLLVASVALFGVLAFPRARRTLSKSRAKPVKSLCPGSQSQASG